MRRLRRLHLFIRDYRTELASAWSIARYRDCERNDHHHWEHPDYNDRHLDALVGSRMRTCTRCGTSETVSLATATQPGVSAVDGLEQRA